MSQLRQKTRHLVQSVSGSEFKRGLWWILYVVKTTNGKVFPRTNSRRPQIRERGPPTKKKTPLLLISQSSNEWFPRYACSHMCSSKPSRPPPTHQAASQWSQTQNEAYKAAKSPVQSYHDRCIRTRALALQWSWIADSLSQITLNVRLGAEI